MRWRSMPCAVRGTNTTRSATSRGPGIAAGITRTTGPTASMRGSASAPHRIRGGVRAVHVRELEPYIAAALGGGPIPSESERLEGFRRTGEAIMLALRTSQGVRLGDFKNRYGVDLLEHYAPVVGRFSRGGPSRTERRRSPADRARPVSCQRCLRSLCNIRLDDQSLGNPAAGRVHARLRRDRASCWDAKRTSTSVLAALCERRRCSCVSDPVAGRSARSSAPCSLRSRNRSSKVELEAVEGAMERLSPAEIAGGAVGLIVGLVIAFLIKSIVFEIISGAGTAGMLHRDRALPFRRDLCGVSWRARRRASIRVVPVPKSDATRPPRRLRRWSTRRRSSTAGSSRSSSAAFSKAR